ncbi:hypothetical protein WHR41_01897 [Cladosporium halotolerans]|uniref:Uncharacterized protein n=1 Tax=Cladosporium halotolerans TaxID=1052096 RepID=A0AB34KVJ3_9PEZI
MDNAQALNADSECAQPCMHHPIAPQYPNGTDLSEFVKTVAEGLERIAFPRPQQRYSSVYVLMISWEDDDLGTAREIAKLKDIFEEDYRYSTRHYEIPSHKKISPGSEPSWELEEVLVQTRNKHGRDEDGLLIIYYGGHGEVSKRSQHSIWKAWKSQPIGDKVPPTSPEIDWSESQAMIMGAKAEILFVLDCCYASASVRDFGQRYRGRRELLLASGNDKASNENTLTKALIYELQDLDASPCTVSSLHARLLQNQSKHSLKPAPIYTCMVGAKAGIVLAPLPDPNAPTSSTPQGTVIPHADRKTLSSPCRVLISVSLIEIGGQSIRETWMEWFRDHAPPNVGAVNLFPLDVTQLIRPVATFNSNSSYLIFSLPVSVWNVMNPNPAINLLSLVRSDNLIESDESTPSVNPTTDVRRESAIGAMNDRISKLSSEASKWQFRNATLRAEHSRLQDSLMAAKRESRRSPSLTKLIPTPSRRDDAWPESPHALHPRDPPNLPEVEKVGLPLSHRRTRLGPRGDLLYSDVDLWAPSLPVRSAGKSTYSVEESSPQRMVLPEMWPAQEESPDQATKLQKPVEGRHGQPEAGGAKPKRGVGKEGSQDKWDIDFVAQQRKDFAETIESSLDEQLDELRDSSGEKEK